MVDPVEIASVRRDLRAECGRCIGLCCVVPAFAASADFAIDKPAGTPCPHLRPDRWCGIHDRLGDRGFRGCAVYDCFGAGQHVVEVTYRGAPPDPAAVVSVFTVVQALHEMLWYLAEAAARADRDTAADVAALRTRITALAAGTPADVSAVDVAAERAAVGPVLERVSAAVRRPLRGPDHRHADRVGRDLRTADLRGADLRGSLLLGADLRDVDLDRADLLGADLRGADLRGARLADALFLTAPQVEAARTDAGTTLPASLPRPAA